jgi:hypothetical protein
LYSLGRRRADKELPLNERLANSVTDTTNMLIRYMSIVAVN